MVVLKEKIFINYELLIMNSEFVADKQQVYGMNSDLKIKKESL